MSRYFYDLHIHSCLSPCADDDMTPNNIAGMAALKGLGLLALTDHNTCRNCPAFFEACRRQGIVPIAGMELSTAEDVHLVCLFEELEAAMAFDREVYSHLLPIENRPDIFGNQLLMNGEDEEIGRESRLLISATDLWMGDAIALAKSYGAHVRPAHIDRSANGMISILGDVPAEYGFRVVEYRDAQKRTELEEQYPALAGTDALFCSDAHHLWDISEAEHSLEIFDDPYSSANVRRNFFAWLRRNENR